MSYPARNIIVIPSADLLEKHQITDYNDPYSDKLGHIPYTTTFYAAVGTEIAQLIHGSSNGDRVAVDWDAVRLDDVISRMRRSITARTGGKAEFVAPRNDIEASIAGAWTDVLGLEQIGVNDNFFAIGGHSLQATQVASRLRDLFGVELPLSDLFVAATIAELGEYIESALLQNVGSAELDDLLAMIESMDEDEIAALAASDTMSNRG